MERLLQDVIFGARVFWKDRGFTTTAVLTLAICIGANTAIFALVNAVLLQPLPVTHAKQLVHMYNAYPGAGVADGGSTGVPDYYDRLRETDVFQEQALYNTRGVTLGQEGNPQRVTALVATPSLLRLLQVRPLRGRFFTDDEGDDLGKTHKVVLTYASWQQYFGGRDDAVGKDLRVNGEPFAVVGILPQAFSFLDPDVKLWTPIAFTPQEKSDDSRHSNNWSYIARLKPGATIERARQQVDALNARNLDRFPQLKQALIDVGFHTAVLPMQGYLVREVRSTLYLLWGGVAFVLLIGAVNITNLILVRSSARMRELTTRVALGAGLVRIARQLLTETIILATAGGVGGLALGWAGIRLLAVYGVHQTPQGTPIVLSGEVVAFTFGIAAVVGVLIGLVPVVSLRHMNLSQAFREEGRSGSASRGSRALRRVLVSAQVAFAFVLLIGAGLLLTSFQRILAVRPGFDPEHVLTGLVSAPASRYKGDAELVQFSNRLLERLRALPGVQAVGITSNLPLSGNYSDSVILAEGYVMRPGEPLVSPYSNRVSPGYFEAMSVLLRRGRFFAASDDDRAPAVVIVDERLAAHFFGDTDPIGRRLWRPESADDLAKGPGPKTKYFTIVGVVGNVRMRGLAEAQNVGAYYFPVAQDAFRTMTIVARSATDPEALTQAIGRDVAAMDPDVPFYGVRSMRARVDESLVNRRMPMLLAALFAGIALFLASVGIYGVLAYQVLQRRREIGIRLALGSDGARIFRLVVREGLALLGVGLGAGFAGAFAIRRAMQSQLYGVQPLDPLVLATVTVVLGMVAFIACAVPAIRAAHIDPVIALSEQ